MAAPATMDTSALRLGELFVNAKGAKSIPILLPDGKPVMWQPGPHQVAFEPSAYNDPAATRVNVCFIPTPDAELCIKGLDAWLINALALESTKYFGSQLSFDQVKERFQSASHTSEKGYSCIRCKMNLVGRTGIQCWDTFRQARPIPDFWRGSLITPKIAVKSVWIMGKDIGCTLELQHAMIDEVVTECPF